MGFAVTLKELIVEDRPDMEKENSGTVLVGKIFSAICYTKGHLIMIVDPMSMIGQNSELLQTDDTPTAVAPSAVIL